MAAVAPAACARGAGVGALVAGLGRDDGRPAPALQRADGPGGRAAHEPRTGALCCRPPSTGAACGRRPARQRAHERAGVARDDDQPGGRGLSAGRARAGGGSRVGRIQRPRPGGGADRPVADAPPVERCGRRQQRALACTGHGSTHAGSREHVLRGSRSAGGRRHGLPVHRAERKQGAACLGQPVELRRAARDGRLRRSGRGHGSHRAVGRMAPINPAAARTHR